jgi:hypothetical protein
MTKLTIPLVALLAGACTVSTNSSTIDPTTLSGSVDGQSWTFVSGYTDSFLSAGSDNYYAVLAPYSVTPCTSSSPTGPHLIVAVPKVQGDYTMNLSRNMTFVDSSINDIAIDGRVVVSTTSSTSLSGGLRGNYDAFNDVNGQFTLTICP